MELSELVKKPFLLLGDVNNPVVTEESITEWGFDDNCWIDVLEICKWGYVLGTLKPKVRCPKCNSFEQYKLNTKHYPYKCKRCLKKFNVFTDTVFSNKKMPFMCYSIIYDNVYIWSEIIFNEFLTNASYYRLKKKFAFMQGKIFDNIFLKWEFLLNYNPNNPLK